MRRLTTLLALILLICAAALLATGCGSDSGKVLGNDSAESSDDSDGGVSGDTESSSDDSSSGDSTTEAEGGGSDVASRDGKYSSPPKLKLDPAKSYVVHVETNKGDFDIDVDPKAAPIAAANFVFLVKDGFYDGVTFHRVIKDFMIQGGDPTGTGTGGPGYSLKDDPVKGEYSRGTVAMANAGPDTGGSQFFIVQGTTVADMLSKDYVIFGSVDAAGMKTVDAIANVEVTTGGDGAPSAPVEPVTITKMTLK